MRYVDDSDPDIVYHGSTPSTTKKKDDIVTIGVQDLVLNEKCSVFNDDECEKVFVSVEFLNYPPEELETPLSLAKGEPNKKYSFNFQKQFPIRDQQKKQQLAEFVAPQSSGEYVILYYIDSDGSRKGFFFICEKQWIRNHSQI